MRFWVRFRPVFLLYAVCSAAVALAVLASLCFATRPEPCWMHVVPVVTVFSAVVALIQRDRFPVWVDPAAIDGFDLLGYPVSVGLAGVKDVRRTTLFGLPYLEVTSLAHRRTLWLPLHLSRLDLFTQLVAEYAGEDHPLTEALSAELPVE